MNDKVIVEKEKWWRWPLCFHSGRKELAPYIWFGWWLVTWGYELDHKWRIHVAFQPD